MKRRLGPFDEHRHQWEPGVRMRRQKCVFCRVNRAEYVKRYKFSDPLDRAIQDLVSFGLLEVIRR